MFCSSCGLEIKEVVSFCSRCGGSVSKDKINPAITSVSEGTQTSEPVVRETNQSARETRTELESAPLETLNTSLKNNWNTFLGVLFFPSLCALKWGVVSKPTEDMGFLVVATFIILAIIGALVYYFSVIRKSYVATVTTAIILSIIFVLGVVFNESSYSQYNWADWFAEASIPLSIVILYVMSNELNSKK